MFVKKQETPRELVNGVFRLDWHIMSAGLKTSNREREGSDRTTKKERIAKFEVGVVMKKEFLYE